MARALGLPGGDGLPGDATLRFSGGLQSDGQHVSGEY
jgi:hypothetical protein